MSTYVVAQRYLITFFLFLMMVTMGHSVLAKPPKDLQLRSFEFTNQSYEAGDQIQGNFEIYNPRRGITGTVRIRVELRGGASLIANSGSQIWSASRNTTFSDSHAITIPAGTPDGQYSLHLVVLNNDESATIAEFAAAQPVKLGVVTPPPPPNNAGWLLTVQNGQLYRNGALWRSRGVNDYAVPRPYDMGDTSSATSYLDKIASITSQASYMQQMKADLPGMNTRRIPLSPRIAEPQYASERTKLEQYIANAKALDDLVVLSVYGSGQYGGADFPERLNDDTNTVGILNRLVPVHQYFADLAAQYGNVAIDIMNEYRENDPDAWAELFSGAIVALRDYGYQGLIIAGSYSWSNHADFDAAQAVLDSDSTGNTCIGFHYYADSGTYGRLNPESKLYWPGMQALIEAGECVGVDEIGVSVSNSINTDGIAGAAIGHFDAWRVLFRDLPFVYAWQTLNDHNSLYGQLRYSRKRGGSVSGSWDNIYNGREPFTLNGLGRLHHEYFIRP